MAKVGQGAVWQVVEEVEAAHEGQRARPRRQAMAGVCQEVEEEDGNRETINHASHGSSIAIVIVMAGVAGRLTTMRNDVCALVHTRVPEASIWIFFFVKKNLDSFLSTYLSVVRTNWSKTTYPY